MSIPNIIFWLLRTYIQGVPFKTHLGIKYELCQVKHKTITNESIIQWNMAFENVPQMMSLTKFWLDFESISFRLYYAC